MKHRILVAGLGFLATMATTSLALADCEADLVQLESAMGASGVSASSMSAMKDAGEKASTALRKDDDATCHNLVVDALKAAGATSPETAKSPAVAGALGDLSSFRTITSDTLALVKKNDLTGAKNRIKDLESAWDQARPKLHSMNAGAWDKLDSAIDAALKALRSSNPDAKASGDALAALLIVIDAS